MICPVCKKKGLSCIVSVHGGSQTLIYSEPYYDEEENWHYHDPNTTTSNYSCSNGHRWSVTVGGSCWCGWKGKGTKMEIIDAS